MDAITPIWNTVLVWPIEWALLNLTEITHSAGIAIILFTIIVRTLLLPLGIKQARSQRAMLQLQPKIKELQRRYGDDRAKFSQEQMRLYRESGVNPVGGCLPLVVQMPIWFALYSALLSLSSGNPSFQSSALWDPRFAELITAFQAPFLWLPSLAHGDPFFILPVLTAATQWVVQKMSTLPSADPQQQQMNRMMEFMPIMFFVFALQVAAGLTLYWIISNTYSFFQQYFTTGWGSLPFLGSRAAASAPANAADDSAAGESAPRAGRQRRKGPGTPPRRRKGR